MEGQDKRLLIAIAISFVFLFIYYAWFLPGPRTETAPAPGKGSTAAPPPSAPLPAALSPVPRGTPSSPEAALAEKEERTVMVETPLFIARLSNRGGVLKSLTLKRFRERMDDPSSQAEMVRNASGQAVLPLQAELTGMSGPLGFGNVLFLMEGKGLAEGKLAVEEKGEGEVLFRTRTPEGLEMEKSLIFHGDRYDIDLRIAVLNRGKSPVVSRLNLAWAPGLEATEEKRRTANEGAVWSADGKVQEIKAKKLTREEEFPARDWIASRNLYFLAALLPGPGFTGAVASHGQDGRLMVGLTAPLQLAPGEGKGAEARVYAGPKEIQALEKTDRTLVGSIDLGWFSIIAKPLLLLLNWLNGFLANYGLAIIVLAILLKVIFIPFNNASFRSMKKMSALQPRINALRDRYRKEPEKLNTEIMALYKENKVNPAGGCLPILIQIPVFIALYRVLSGAIELRHAPFILWIGDLSAKDPYYVTPILMGATMFIQQKMTPTAGDPKQAQIMLFLPIIFTAMFISLPSGLVLYWLVTNVLSIGHQYILLGSDREKKAGESPRKKG